MINDYMTNYTTVKGPYSHIFEFCFPAVYKPNNDALLLLRKKGNQISIISIAITKHDCTKQRIKKKKIKKTINKKTNKIMFHRKSYH